LKTNCAGSRKNPPRRRQDVEDVGNYKVAPASRGSFQASRLKPGYASMSNCATGRSHDLSDNDKNNAAGRCIEPAGRGCYQIKTRLELLPASPEFYF
jgi:hypothetical protein